MSDPDRNETKAHVWIVDDHKDVGDSLVDLLQIEGWDAACFYDAESFIKSDAMECGGIIFLDFFLPGLSSLEVLERLKVQPNDFAVVLISGVHDIPNVVAGMRAGALDFLTKPVAPDALRKALANCQDYLADQEAFRDRIRDARGRLDRLTGREAEVLELMVQGMQNKEIAHSLDISQRTAETHRARVMSKMEARNLAHLFQLMIQARLGVDAPINGEVEE